MELLNKGYEFLKQVFVTQQIVNIESISNSLLLEEDQITTIRSIATVLSDDEEEASPIPRQAKEPVELEKDTFLYDDGMNKLIIFTNDSALFRYTEEVRSMMKSIKEFDSLAEANELPFYSFNDDIRDDFENDEIIEDPNDIDLLTNKIDLGFEDEIPSISDMRFDVEVGIGGKISDEEDAIIEEDRITEIVQPIANYGTRSNVRNRKSKMEDRMFRTGLREFLQKEGNFPSENESNNKDVHINNTTEYTKQWHYAEDLSIYAQYKLYMEKRLNGIHT